MKALLNKLRNLNSFRSWKSFFSVNDSLLSLSLLAIEHADCSNNKNLLAIPVFIKMKAILCLGDFVPAFKLAVWCKHLRLNVSTCSQSIC